MPWLFAYGHFLSLLPDDASLRPERARLKGYRGAFTAKSTTDWGSRANPAPMLALVPGASSRGLALELSEDSAAEVLAAWHGDGADRVQEGEAEVGMPFRRDAVRVTFRTVDPEGPHALGALSVERLARMVVVARGRRGTGVDYLKAVNEKLREWGLEEPALAALWKEVEKERSERWR